MRGGFFTHSESDVLTIWLISSYVVFCMFQCLFEVITSETSYTKSLDVLQLHFKKPLREARSLASEEDFKRLFSNIDKIAEAARK